MARFPKVLSWEQSSKLTTKDFDENSEKEYLKLTTFDEKVKFLNKFGIDERAASSIIENSERIIKTFYSINENKIRRMFNSYFLAKYLIPKAKKFYIYMLYSTVSMHTIMSIKLWETYLSLPPEEQLKFNFLPNTLKNIAFKEEKNLKRSNTYMINLEN